MTINLSLNIVVLIINLRIFLVIILKKDFIKKIKNREIAIMAGDLLDCKFKSRIMFNDINQIVESKYYVLLVFGIIPPPEEDKLDIL